MPSPITTREIGPGEPDPDGARHAVLALIHAIDLPLGLCIAVVPKRAWLQHAAPTADTLNLYVVDTHNLHAIEKGQVPRWHARTRGAIVAASIDRATPPPTEHGTKPSTDSERLPFPDGDSALMRRASCPIHNLNSRKGGMI